MTKDKLLKHMENVIAEIIADDEENWKELLEAGEYEEIDLDRAFHHGYLSAINSVRNLLDD